ncbi:MAG: DUF805 domain-containing protein [Muribaculaceae bacterium]|jgi:uncharacterized membrane protein YhaH (DUF805 family)|nr:DUF805 domain-containing protein [Muribaculaceae bacterium]
MKYYIAENGQPVGPFEIHELLQRGLNMNSQLWNEGMPSWLTASQIPEVAAALNARRAAAQPQPAPAYSAPQQPQYGAPQQPQYGAPQQPQYGAPQQPQYGAAAPSANGYRALPQVDIKTAVIKALQPYFNFEGRARRSEYWWFVLANFCASIVLSFLGNLINFPWLTTILSLALLIPSLGLTARRLHDIGKSGWLMLISIIPIVGAILLIIWCAKDGDPQPNQYGPSTKYVV